MKAIAERFKAISDESRLEILALILVGGELCVCDVEGALGITQSKASRHLRYLLNAGLLENRREGPWMHYLVPKGIDPAGALVLNTVRKLIAGERRNGLEARLASWLETKRATSECSPTGCSSGREAR